MACKILQLFFSLAKKQSNLVVWKMQSRKKAVADHLLLLTFLQRNLLAKYTQKLTTYITICLYNL